MGCVAACYLALLTLCLVARNPFWVAGHREGMFRWMFDQYVAPVSHLLSFFVAGLLCGLGCSRAPGVSCWGLWPVTRSPPRVSNSSCPTARPSGPTYCKTSRGLDLGWGWPFGSAAASHCSPSRRDRRRPKHPPAVPATSLARSLQETAWPLRWPPPTPKRVTNDASPPPNKLKCFAATGFSKTPAATLLLPPRRMPA